MTNKRSETKLPGLLIGTMDGGASGCLERRVMRLLDARLPWTWRWRVLSAVGCAAVMAAVCLGGAMVSVRAQEKAIKFDVVSIRPTAPGVSVYSGNGGPHVTDDGYSWMHLPIAGVMTMANFGLGERSAPIQNLPDWMKQGNYDVVAKVAPEDAEEWKRLTANSQNGTKSNATLQYAIRTMLEERLKLTEHRVPTEMDGYALIVGKGGLKMAAASASDAIPEKGMDFPGGGKAVSTSQDRKIIHWTFYNATIEDLRNFVANNFRKTLVDQTGQKGRYRFVLDPREFAPDETKNPDGSDFWNLESLGLGLKVVKVKSEIVVIDHIERPTEN